MTKLKEIIIETPEKIRFSYQLAEVGTRVAAYLVDTIVQGLILLPFIIIFITINSAGLSAHENDFNLSIGAFFLIIYFLLTWFYYVIAEILMEGQSPGKKLMRLRVLRADGDSLDFETILLRNFLRLVDGFPLVPLTGGFIALIDPRNRRLGDLMANTLVVNEIQFNLALPDFQVHFSSQQTQELSNETIKQKLSEHELYIIRRFLNEYRRLPESKQREVADNLAMQVRKKLALIEAETNSLLFLERIYKQHGV